MPISSGPVFLLYLESGEVGFSKLLQGCSFILINFRWKHAAYHLLPPVETNRKEETTWNPDEMISSGLIYFGSQNYPERSRQRSSRLTSKPLGGKTADDRSFYYIICRHADLPPRPYRSRPVTRQRSVCYIIDVQPPSHLDTLLDGEYAEWVASRTQHSEYHKTKHRNWKVFPNAPGVSLATGLKQIS